MDDLKFVKNNFVSKGNILSFILLMSFVEFC